LLTAFQAYTGSQGFLSLKGKQHRLLDFQQNSLHIQAALFNPNYALGLCNKTLLKVRNMHFERVDIFLRDDVKSQEISA
jgi:hypothetical protein